MYLSTRKSIYNIKYDKFYNTTQKKNIMTCFFNELTFLGRFWRNKILLIFLKR